MANLRSRRRSLRSVLALASAGLLTAAPAVADDQVVRLEPALAYGDMGLVMVADDSLAGAGTAADFASPAPAAETPVAVAEPEAQTIAEGIASYYGNELAGNRTASGERFNPKALTAAHRRLPLGSKLRVTNLSNGRSVNVRVNDRGPFHGNRVLDVSLAAARQIGMLRTGTAKVKLELLR